MELAMKRPESNVDYKSKQIAYLLHQPLTETEAAGYLGVAVQTLRNWRHLRKGPAYVKLSPGPSGRIVYLLQDLTVYRDQCRVDPTGMAS